jgi:hypothetical protein
MSYELYLFRADTSGLTLPDDLERPESFESLDRAATYSLLATSLLVVDDPDDFQVPQEVTWEGRALIAQLWLGDEDDGPLRLPTLSIVRGDSDDERLFETEVLKVATVVLEIAATLGAHVYDPQQEIFIHNPQSVLNGI